MSCKRYGRVLGVCAVLALGGCESLDTAMGDFKTHLAAFDGASRAHPEAVNGACPEAILIEDLESMTEFIDSSDPQDSDMVSRIRLAGMDSSCETRKGQSSVDLVLTFESEIGPRGRVRNGDRPFFAYPYFIAVSGPDGTILGKEVFVASVAYDAEESRRLHEETARQTIPVARGHVASDYKVMVGFQISREQLAYNRQIAHMQAVQMAQEAGHAASITPAAGAE